MLNGGFPPLRQRLCSSASGQRRQLQKRGDSHRCPPFVFKNIRGFCPAPACRARRPLCCPSSPLLVIPSPLTGPFHDSLEHIHPQVMVTRQTGAPGPAANWVRGLVQRRPRGWARPHVVLPRLQKAGGGGGAGGLHSASAPETRQLSALKTGECATKPLQRLPEASSRASFRPQPQQAHPPPLARIPPSPPQGTRQEDSVKAPNRVRARDENRGGTARKPSGAGEKGKGEHGQEGGTRLWEGGRR